ncbi:tRNA uridine-5-carboxymethylaminomethyl(34) synthesis GTPase MnmE [soil metagenome]
MRLDFATIAAVSTPPGAGGIGVIRISGPDASVIAGKVFRRPDGTVLDIQATQSHRVIFGQICDPHSRALIDEVLLTWMAAPHTYTCEDVVEISCHGGPVPVQETLRVVLGQGARHAEPGEFTLRAFVNGRLDLTQAEAVLNVVDARTAEGLQLAIEDLRGEMTRRIAPARNALVSLLAYLDAAADFPDDEIPPTDIDSDLSTAVTALEAIIAGARAGMLYREGAQVALVGRPNVGKSSLMNALLRSDRAIVTPIAGTTRDVISETCNIQGIPVTLLDTAGIADTADIVERLGIERSQRALSAASVAVLVLDGSVPPAKDDRAIAGLLGHRLSSPDSISIPVVVAVNKRDLPERASQQAVIDRLSGAAVVSVSSQTGDGLEELETAVVAGLSAGSGSVAQPALITARQRAALDRARDHLAEASATRAAELPIDLMATDVRAALYAIGEVTGENIDEAVLTEIFSRFCIGK